MSILKDINYNINEDERLFNDLADLMVECEEVIKSRFSILEMDYNPDGSVEWDQKLASSHPVKAGINRDTGAGLERRARVRSTTPKVADVVLVSNEQGQMIPAMISDLDQSNAILSNKKHNFKQKIDTTTLRQATGEVAKKFAVKYPDRTFWQVG